MLLATTPPMGHLAPSSRPTPRERQLTWATILLLLAVFWSGVAVALWGTYAG